MPEARRPGRWRTGQQSRQRILDAARKRFMHDGYERATVRAIAADAGVDVAMVYYFFDNKEGLINAAALTGPEHPLHQLAMQVPDAPSGGASAIDSGRWRSRHGRLVIRR